MTDAVDAGGRRCRTQRLGRFGAMLRELSIDELPELGQRKQGDMSLVDPGRS